MTRKRRVVAGLVVVLGVLLIGEGAYHVLRSPTALVQVENVGPEPIERLVVTCGASRVEVGTLAPEKTAKVWVGTRGVADLVLTFSQKGNALTNYQLPGFDAEALAADDFKIVVRIGTNAVERFQDDGEPATPLGRWVRSLWKRVWDALQEKSGVEPDVEP